MDLILQYMSSCFNGTVAAAECGAVWQFTAIGVLIIAALGALVVLRVRAGRDAAARDS